MQPKSMIWRNWFSNQQDLPCLRRLQIEKAQTLIKSRKQALLKKSFSSKSMTIDPSEFEHLEISQHMSIQLDNKNDNKKLELNSFKRIDQLSMQAHFFNLLVVGGSSEKEEIISMLENDPKRNFYPFGHPNCLVNQLNLRNQTPLHIACTNNNRPLINLLLDFGADPKLKSTVSVVNDRRQLENALETSVRWGYVDIVDCLLKRCQWSRQEIKSAIKLAPSPKLKSMLRVERKKLRKSVKSHHSVCAIF